ncbi:SLC13 family permease [Noviherbaspirillum suwonense]|jgi:di/tricarboxylate transporter|uniref:Transporter, YbiR family n=1 Tax=Noviherbaspirillum suwonense TaxID=1224511 RepID=A0ABY1Q3C2_9BURK|nr:SLC13 family permease [Noviherbaspirillum suwonense]SMP54997.1 transporter, YbiR family [Noviherbaspirillum suwonense]
MADGASAAPPLRAFLAALAGDYLLWTLLLALAAFSMARPAAIPDYLSLVDWRTIATLTGLLALTKGVERSGYLPQLAQRLVAAIPTERSLAVFLVLATALLATVLTNDVALFVVVPLTLTLKSSGAPLTRLIVFEALAANAGSVLTPIGNPQNLFLWQLSHVTFGQFTLAMLPLAAVLLAPLLLLTLLAFSGKRLHLSPRQSSAQPDRLMLMLALGLYIPFLVITDLRHPYLALLALAPLLLARRELLARLDWALILVFVLMFIDLRLLSQLDVVRAWIGAVDLRQLPHLYLAGIAASQVVSNVPAAILLAEYSHDWRVIAYAVNVGGFGFMIGSLANIIALRMAPDRRAWISFHAYSLPFLLVAGGLAWLLLR